MFFRVFAATSTLSALFASSNGKCIDDVKYEYGESLDSLGSGLEFFHVKIFRNMYIPFEGMYIIYRLIKNVFNSYVYTQKSDLLHFSSSCYNGGNSRLVDCWLES